MSKKILIVDDNESLRQMVKSYLVQEGYRVLEAADGRIGLLVARQERPDLVVLDLMMPEMDGYEFMRIYTKESDTPIIILTARIDETDKVLGLELGGDDYVTKPFSPRELTARVRAVLRRMGKVNPIAELVRLGEIELDRSGRTVRIEQRYIELTPSEFDILAALMSEPGRVFSRLDLLTLLQGAVVEGYERSIDVHVRNLRTKIEEDPSNPIYVETVYGIGYRFSKRHLMK